MRRQVDHAAHRQALALAQPRLCHLLDGTGVNGAQSSALCINLLLAQDDGGPADVYKKATDLKQKGPGS